jgi:hypothetical protein
LLEDEKEEAKMAKIKPGSREEVSEVLPFLILTGKGFATQHGDKLASFGITHHCNAAKELTIIPRPKIAYMMVDLAYIVKDPLEQVDKLEKAAKFIEECKAKEGICLVNCARGRSRSVAVVLYYLMTRENMSMREAYLHTKKVRDFIGPSAWLQTQLREIEVQVRGEATFEKDKKWKDQMKAEMKKSK